MAKHNKKRNIGIIYELMLRHISNCLIEGDMKGVKLATSILEKRFNKETELFREFRLFNAIAKSTVKNTEVAAAILTEAKQAARRIDATRLNKEKSSLIRDINHKINDKKFYYRTIPEYKDYAGIQNLINEWRKEDRSDLKRLVSLEKSAIDVLLREKVEKDVYSEKQRLESSDSDRLVMKIMTEKINKKYGDMLPSQKEIIKNYALYGTNDKEYLVNFLREKKQESIASLCEFKNSNENEFIAKKIHEVENRIGSLDPEDITDQTMVRFLTLTKLISEIKGA